MMQVTFAYSAISGTFNFSGTSSNTHAIWIYDVTNAAWIQPQGVYNLVQGSGVGKCTATFQTTSNSTKYQLALININATSGAYTLYVDDFYVGPQTAPSGPAVGDWNNNLTFTYTGLGTVSNNNVQTRRVGDTLEIQGSVTPGSTTGTTFQLNMPSGYTMNTAKLGSAQQALGPIWRGVGGSVAFPSASAGPYLLFYDGSTNNAIFLSVNVTNGSYSKDVGANFSSGNIISFHIAVPIAGWSSNSVQSSDTDTRVVAASAFISAASVAASTSTPVNFDTVTYDTHAAVTTGSGWKFTAPVTGYYDVLGAITGSTSASMNFSIYKNGSLFQVVGGSANISTAPTSFTGQVQLNAGDYIDLRPGSNITFIGGSRGSTGNASFVQISIRTGPAVITATESVNARYYSSTSSVSGSFGTITYSTKDFDSHNAYSSGTYTIPVSGKYEINGKVAISASFTSGEGNTIAIFKNGTEVSENTALASSTISNSFDIEVSDIISCLAGDLITIKILSNGGSPSVVSNNVRNFFSISRTGN